MYLHLGQNVVIPQSTVIGIFDIDNTTSSHTTREYLNRAEKEGRFINVFDDIPKSFVVCEDGDEIKVYLSQLSSSTLLKRAEGLGFDI